jgi:preprotein translocase subunit YajC
MISILSLMMPLAFQMQTPGGWREWGNLLFLPISIMLIFYFLVFMPHRKRQRELQAFLAGLKKGDRVVTTGGVYAEVVAVDTATVILKIADNVKVKVAKTAIASHDAEGDKGDNR